MADIKKYQGVFPGFYACYEDNGSVSPARTRAFAKYLLEKGLKGLYVGGNDHHCLRRQQQHRRLSGAGPPCRAFGYGRHRHHRHPCGHAHADRSDLAVVDEVSAMIDDVFAKY